MGHLLLGTPSSAGSSKHKLRSSYPPPRARNKCKRGCGHLRVHPCSRSPLTILSTASSSTSVPQFILSILLCPRLFFCKTLLFIMQKFFLGHVFRICHPYTNKSLGSITAPGKPCSEGENWISTLERTPERPALAVWPVSPIARVQTCPAIKPAGPLWATPLVFHLRLLL